MEFIKSWKFMAIIIGVFSAVVIAGIIYGVTTHSEAGLMENAAQWDREHFPLAVCSSAYADTAATGDATAAVASAVRVTNERLGFTAFVIADGDCQVQVTIGVPAEAGWLDPGGDALIIPDGHGGPGCEVRTSNVHGELQGLVLQHELSHCLGLDHDEWEGSIMRREQSTTPDGAFPPRITDSDRDLLRSMYAPED